MLHTVDDSDVTCLSLVHVLSEDDLIHILKRFSSGCFCCGQGMNHAAILPFVLTCSHVRNAQLASKLKLRTSVYHACESLKLLRWAIEVRAARFTRSRAEDAQHIHKNACTIPLLRG